MHSKIIDRLIFIRDHAKALPSLKPGEGYDPLGFELCDIVQKTNLNYQEREEFFAALNAEDSSLLYDLQQISVISEMELEKIQAEKILNRLSDKKNRDDIFSAPQDERLKKILFDYPYGWATVRAKEKIRLFKTLIDDFSALPLLYFGRSMLPISGLGMHFATGLPIIWGDIHDESRSTAATFVQSLENFEILEPGAFRMTDGKDIATEEGQALIILDDPLMQQDIYKKAHKKDLPLMMSEPFGLARLLYPTSARKAPNDQLYKKHAVILASHADDENIGDALHLPASNQDLFVSLSLYGPVHS